MTRTLRVFFYELRRQGRRRAYLFTSIGIPIIALIAFAAYTIYRQAWAGETPESSARASESLRENTRPIGLVDQSGLIKGPSFFSGMIAFKDEGAAEQAMREGRIAAYYLVPADYLTTGDVRMYFDRFSLTYLTASTALNRLLLDSLTSNAGLESAVIDRLQNKTKFIAHSITESGGAKRTANNETSFLLAYLFSLALIFSSFMTSGYLMQSIVEEKETRIVEILLSSLRPIHLLAGKILALGLLGLFQMVLWGATLMIILHQLPSLVPELLGLTPPSLGQLMLLIVYFILGYLLLAAAYASIGAIATTMREGPQLAALVTLPMAIPMWALTAIAAAPNGTLAVILSLIPPTAPLTMVSRIAITDVPAWQIAASVALLLLNILFVVWLTSRLFRVHTLLSGQLPRLRDLPRLLREP